jgi:membrane-associated phospholipid phosphatase
MRTPDLIALVYFSYVIAAAGLVREVAVERRLRVAGMAAGAILLVLLSGQILPAHSVVRDWLPVVWLLLGYWLPGGLLHEPMPGVEAWLKASDRWIQETPWARRPPGWLSAMLELAYFLVHVFVPAGFLVLAIAGLDASEHFWTPVLLAGYACYGTLPWLQARPPRLVESPPHPACRDKAGVRGWNERLLDALSVKANTFPSGHVAVALAVALVMLDLLPVAGVVFVPLALLIAAATVVRRYHYTADAALGLVVAVLCWAGSRLI